MNKNVQFFVMLCMFFVSLTSSPDRFLTLPESIFVGGFSGALEALAPGHLLTYLMNRKIEKLPIVLSKFHEGIVAHVAGLFCITAAVKTSEVKGSLYLKGLQDGPLSEMQKIGVSLGSGAVGGVIDTFSNAVQLHQQRTGKNVMRSCVDLGLKGGLRGLTPSSLKEAQFALGWQFLGPKGKQLACQYFEKETTAEVVGGAGAGVITAVITHPFAVIRNKMQGDITKASYTTTLQTVQRLCKQEGARALFKGLPERGLRIAIAIPLYSKYSKELEAWVKE